MSEPSKIRAPYIVRTISQDQIESGLRLQKVMEELSRESARELADELKADDEQRRVEQERASIEAARRAESPAVRYMDSKYGWVNNPKG